MNERPILMNGAMVRAILEGRKTQTRRLIKPQPFYNDRGAANPWQWVKSKYCRIFRETLPLFKKRAIELCPQGVVGDHLWVRETHTWITLAENEWRGTPDQRRHPNGYSVAMLYRADAYAEGGEIPASWRPSIHMPRWACRLTLEITDVRAQRVKDITDADAYAEGAWHFRYDDASGPPVYVADGECIDCFRELWDSIYSTDWDWDQNPWVWVIEFRVLND